MKTRAGDRGEGRGGEGDIFLYIYICFFFIFSEEQMWDPLVKSLTEI